MLSCQPEAEIPYYTLKGQAQGTTYQITYSDNQSRNFQAQLDSLLERVNQSLSTYHEGSLINQFNQSLSLETDDPLFLDMIEQSGEVYRQSEGAFDPTVMPLVRAWGFGPEKEPEQRIENLDSLRQFVGFDQLQIEPGRIGKNQAGMQLDFNAIAQGYTVDLIGDFLKRQGVANFMVELGGEVLTLGKNARGQTWNLGIEQPLEIPGIQALAAKVALADQALATSGSYKKFYVKDGVKYSHTIDPFAGRPVDHSLLSVSVVTDHCAKADAFATVFMVWGVEKSQTFIAAHPELEIEAYFISASKGDGWEIEMTEGMREILEEFVQTQ
jgi:thiamine biosynthesis lipoprotein